MVVLVVAGRENHGGEVGGQSHLFVTCVTHVAFCQALGATAPHPPTLLPTHTHRGGPARLSESETRTPVPGGQQSVAS
jgi:hypothetical protein